MTCVSEEQDISNIMDKDKSNASHDNPRPVSGCQQSHDGTEELFGSYEESTQVKITKGTIDGQQIFGEIIGRKCNKKEVKKDQAPIISKRPKRASSAVNCHRAFVGKNSCVKETGHSFESMTRSKSSCSVHDVDNSLGETLATSLQLIATNSCSPPHPDSLLDQSSCGRDSLNYNTEYETLPISPPRQSPQSLEDTSPYTVSMAVKKKKRGRKPKKKLPGVDLEEKYLSDSEMMKPILHNDGSVTLFQCEVCHKLFNKRQTLRQHFITHTDRFACQFCDARCKSKGDLRTHIQTHTKEKPYHCDICNTDYTRESILRKHLKTQLHLRAVYEREDMVKIQKYCGKKNIGPLKQFIPSKTKVRLDGLPCGQCSRVLLTKAEYRKHMKTHFLTHVCNVCQKGCKTALLLKIHLRSHANDNKLSCKICARKFINLQVLKDHSKIHKESSASKEHDQNLIKAVINKHNKDIKMMKVSKKQESAKPKVKQEHTPRKATFECTICHRMFTSEKRLSNHSHTHKEDFSCNICFKSFPNLSKLNNHMLDHEKLIVKCEICHASYGDQDELKMHMENQHCEGSELVCKICYKKFESPIDVHKHMNDHAPTMLFSGGNLDESSIPVVKGGKKMTYSSLLKISDSEDSSDDEKKASNITKNVEEQALHKQNDVENTDDNQLTTAEFFEIMDAAIELDDTEINFDDLSDFEDEVFTSIVEVLESDILSSAESDFNEDFDEEEEDVEEEGAPSVEKPILFCHGDIVRKHGEEFEQFCHKDPSTHLFQCSLCTVNFDKEKHMSDHLKCHVCEYCNKFFTDTGKLSLHKSSHVKRLLSKIDTETKRMHLHKQKWKNFLVDSSDSEADNEDRFLNELEDILESESSKNARTATFLKTLSHDDIVKANKPMFDEHSFVDMANNIFACTICKRKYARPTTLTRHFKTHVCQYCNTFFTDKSDLLEHKYRHRKKAALIKAEITGEGGKMPPSPVVSKENRTLFKRFSYVDGERNINRCTLCSKNFVRRTVLTRHLKTHICAHCDKFFEDKYDLVKHTTFHKVEKNYTEEDGDDEGEDFVEYDEEAKSFPPGSSPTLRMGQKVLSIPSSFSSTLPPYTSSFHVQPSCNTRNEPITYIQLPSSGNVGADNAQVYSAQSNGTSSFPIISQPVNVYKENGSDCFLVSSTNCQSNNQDKIITISQPQILSGDSVVRERLFECGECGKRFFKNGHLKSHMNIHTGSRPYVCNVCGKAFGRGTTLRKHEKTHLKRCKICDTTFASKYELDLHLEIHRTYAFYKKI
ncbi:Zinc finger protein [Plakobranchus ocellatus]|uniref:Zinc finger protein n=1 Tax=Plakobranchus ocellatus TaxID=259542 RepID=A0AAV3Z3H5_9GAST|nr:Zinc finger protein [Plakobranchus ocellatus]